MKKAIIFDAEGIVIDTEDTWDNALRLFLAKRGIVYKREEVKHLVTGKSIHESVVVLKEKFSLLGELNDLALERINIIEEILPKEAKYINGFNNFFDKISTKYKSCIATSLDRKILDNVIKNIKLDRYFDERIYSVSDIGNISKPNPAIFLHSANKIGCKPDECIVIEDSPSGIKGAKNAGMTCIALSTTHEKEKLFEADYIFNSYQELSTFFLVVF